MRDFIYRRITKWWPHSYKYHHNHFSLSQLPPRDMSQDSHRILEFGYVMYKTDMHAYISVRPHFRMLHVRKRVFLRVVTEINKKRIHLKAMPSFHTSITQMCYFRNPKNYGEQSVHNTRVHNLTYKATVTRIATRGKKGRKGSRLDRWCHRKWTQVMFTGFTAR
jgi:hypothetical protein